MPGHPGMPCRLLRGADIIWRNSLSGAGGDVGAAAPARLHRDGVGASVLPRPWKCSKQGLVKFEQPGLVKNIPACGRRVGMR